MASILVVDDDPTIRTMFVRALGKLGEVDQASNGGEALRMLGAKKYEALLLDLHMPVMDGFVVMQTLASRPGPNRDTAVFVITADTSERARLQSMARHALFFLNKPVQIATLTMLVDNALKKAAKLAAGQRVTPTPPEVAPSHGGGRKPPT